MIQKQKRCTRGQVMSSGYAPIMSSTVVSLATKDPSIREGLHTHNSTEKFLALFASCWICSHSLAPPTADAKFASRAKSPNTTGVGGGPVSKNDTQIGLLATTVPPWAGSAVIPGSSSCTLRSSGGAGLSFALTTGFSTRQKDPHRHTLALLNAGPTCFFLTNAWARRALSDGLKRTS